LKHNRDQLRWVVGLFTGHCHLNGHLFKLRLMDSPICERCLEEDESATHILCDCEAIAHLRFRHPGQFFMEPGDYYGTPISQAVQFVRSAGFIKGKQNRSVMIALQGPVAARPSFSHTYIHTYIHIPVQAIDAPTFSDNRLTDDGEVVSPTRRPPFTSRKIPGTHFC
jgi:hypothetical protein